jgi:hypothetical protein
VGQEAEFEEFTGTIVTVRGSADAMLAGTLRSAARPLAEAVVLSAPAPQRLVDEGEIARGGMGSIRAVLDTGVLRRLAMKLLEPTAADLAGPTRFLEEARISGQLEHPNIVPVHDVGLHPDGTPAFFTMKLVQGKTFKELILEHPTDGRSGEHLERLVNVLLKVCDAVAFAHTRGVIHRDLKPSNVMVGTHGQVYLMDWGLALLLPPERQPAGQIDSERVRLQPGSMAGNADPAGTIAGTGAFMAPEQAMGKIDAIDQRTDVFGLGAILYQVLTKSSPYRGRSLETVLLAQKCEIEPPEARVGAGVELPPELCRIAMRALSREPGARYQTVDAFASEIQRALRGGLWLSTRTFAPGDIVVREGERGDAAYIIQEGHCEAYKTEGGARVTLRSMGPGEAFGETAVLTEHPRTASVEATTRLVLRVVTREALQAELAASPSIAAFVRALAERFRDLDARLARLRGGGHD